MALTDDLKALEDKINELNDKIELIAGVQQEAPQNRRERADAKKARLEEDRVERREKSEENLNRVRDQRDEARGSQLDEGVKELESARREQEDFQSGDGHDLDAINEAITKAMQKDPQALQHFEEQVGKQEEDVLKLPADTAPKVNAPLQRELRTNAQPGYITLKAEDSSGDYARFEVLGIKTGAATEVCCSNYTTPLTVGVDGTGYDVTFFGDTPGSFMLWDESDDALEFTNSTLSITGGNTGQLTINAGNAAHSATITLDTTESNGEWRMGALGSDESFFITNVDQGGTSAFSIHPTTKNVTLAADLFFNTDGKGLHFDGVTDWDWIMRPVDSGSSNVPLIFESQNNSSSSPSERFRINSAGDAIFKDKLTVEVIPSVTQEENTVLVVEGSDGSLSCIKKRELTTVNLPTYASSTSGIVKIGDDDDLQLYHSGGVSYVQKITAGDLYIRNNSTNDVIIGHNSNKGLLYVPDNRIELRFNDVKKFETTDAGITVTGNITVTGTVDGRDVATDGTALDTAVSKLSGIDTGAKDDQTAAEIRYLVEAATDSNAYTDAHKAFVQALIEAASP